MVTDSNSQINTFIRGMNTDASYQMIQEGQYTDANNIRVTSLTQGNTDKTNSYGEVRPIEGIDIVHTINDKVDNILATGYIRNLGVIIYRTTSIGLIDPIHPKTFEQWKVYVYNMETNEGEVNFTSPKEEVQLHSNIPRKFSITLRYEDEDNIKLYIADGVHPIMVLNIAKDNSQLSIDQIQSYPSIRFTKPIFCGLIPGRLKAGLVQYSYRLYNKNGVSTDVSPTTRLIPIATSNGFVQINNSDILTVEEGKDINGLLDGDTSNVGVRVKFKIDKDYNYLDYIQIFKISYIQNGQTPTVGIIYDGKIKTPLSETDESGNITFTYDDVLEDYVRFFTLEEYNSMSGIHIVPKVIESKNDYLFAAKIKDQQQYFDINIDDSFSATILLVKSKLHGDYFNPEENTAEDINKKMRISLEGGIDINANNIEYIREDSPNSTSVLDASDYFENYTGTKSYADSQMSYYMKSLRRGETYRYGVIFYNKYGLASRVIHIGDVKVPEIHRRRSQAEVPFDNQSLNSDLDYTNTFSVEDDGNLYVYPLGVHIVLHNIPEDAVSYEIVRCNRTVNDIRNLSQGVISRPIYRIKDEEIESEIDPETPVTNVHTYPFTPTGFLTIADFRMGSTALDSKQRWAQNYDNNNLIQFVSPEISYNKDSFENLLKNNSLRIYPIQYLYPYYSDVKNDTSVNYVINSISPSNANIRIRKQDFQNGYPYGAATIFIEDTAPTYFDGTNVNQHNRYDTFGYTDTFGNYHKIEGTAHWDVVKRNAYAYIKLYLTSHWFELQSPNDNDFNNYYITDTEIPQNIQWNDVFSTQTSNDKTQYIKKYQDFISAVGGNEYCNIIMGGIYDEPVEEICIKDGENKFEVSNHTDDHIIGLGGQCLILTTKGNVFTPKQPSEDYKDFMGTILCNIVQNNIVPYGGNSSDAKSRNIYYSYGDFFNVTNHAQQDACIFDGDCFILPFEYVSMHKYYTPLDKMTGVSSSIIYSIPVETNINLAYTSGNEFSKCYKDSGITNLQIEPSRVYNVYTQKKPLYVYNSVYSTYSTAKLFAAVDKDNEDLNLNTDYRVYHSLLKTNDERIDSWTKFMPADYIDVDTRYGEVTELRTFHNKLIFWQKDAMGMLSVNERAAVTDDSNMPLILGTSGILSRYDYIDETAGMMPEQYVDTYSNTTLYWYDAAHKEIKSYNEGSTVTQLSKAKSVQNKLNKSSNNKPYIMFDNKYNTVIADVLENKNIMYDETLQQFVSTTDVVIQGSMKHDDNIYVVNRNKIALLDHPTDTNEYVDWDGNKLSTYLEYVVNKSPLTTKVFDNQEIVTVNNPVEYNLESPHEDRQSYYTHNHSYTWTTDLNTTSTDNLETTLREGNYRYSIPRHGNEEYGNRMRGKYMICSITDTDPHMDSSLSYIITKFRTSWS